MSLLLARLPGRNFSQVQRIWETRTAVIMACGNSLTEDQVEMVRQARLQGRVGCIAINDAYLIAPFADVCYFADSEWWQWHTDGIAKPALGLTASEVRERFASFAGQKCTVQGSGNNVVDPAVHMLRNAHHYRHGTGISLDPEALVTGRHSGHQALNMAILSGTPRVLLLGYDGHPGDDPAKPNFHGTHPTPTPDAAYAGYRESFERSKAEIVKTGVQVINCSPGTQINTFPKQPLAQALA